jgi:hypothetical protein
MSEFFIVGNSFAAPFFSDELEGFVEAENAGEALLKFKADCKHPFGLYAAVAYRSADSYHRREKALGRWISNSAKAKEGAISILANGPGEVKIDGKWVTIDAPKEGAVYYD